MSKQSVLEMMKDRERKLVNDIALLYAKLDELRMWLSNEIDADMVRGLDRDHQTSPAFPQPPAAVHGKGPIMGGD
jgi:hypothetical protein